MLYQNVEQISPTRPGIRTGSPHYTDFCLSKKGISRNTLVVLLNIFPLSVVLLLANDLSLLFILLTAFRVPNLFCFTYLLIFIFIVLS